VFPKGKPLGLLANITPVWKGLPWTNALPYFAGTSVTKKIKFCHFDTRSESAIGDFGGDYGNYLQLLEGDSALGFNPQSDPIADNQVKNHLEIEGPRHPA
jgi:hypothetical protein